MPVKRNKIIAVICPSINKGIDILKEMHDLKEYHKSNRKAVGIDGTVYFLGNQPEHFMGILFSDRIVMPGSDTIPSYEHIYRLVTASIREGKDKYAIH